MDPKDPNLLHQVFDDRGALLVFFGALGGLVRSAALQTTWREGLRVTFIGAACSFGVGVLAPTVLKPWIGALPDGIEGTLGGICAAAFLTGLVAVTMIERFIARKGGDQ